MDDDYLMLSGVQHMAFCERQWALIHIEQVWQENVYTVEGKYLHDKTDNPFKDEIRKDLRIVRAMPLVSEKLGLRGIADVVEFIRVKDPIEGVTIKLDHRVGNWIVYPVEYKRGKPKKNDCDAVQLCAQAIALEEMLHISIESGYLFYEQTRRRQQIEFTENLRIRVFELCKQMQVLMKMGKTPMAVAGKNCPECSLINYCHPEIMIKSHSVEAYINKMTKLEVIEE